MKMNGSVWGTRGVRGYEGICVRGTRVFVSGVRRYLCPGYEGGMRVFVSGVRGWYEGICVRGTRVV